MPQIVDESHDRTVVLPGVGVENAVAPARAELRRAEDMPGRMERDANATHVDGFSVRERFNVRPVAHPGSQDGSPVLRRQVMPSDPACMIRMGMRHDRPIHRTPGIDMKATGWTVKPNIC